MLHFSEGGWGGPIWKCQIFIRGRAKVFRQQPENKSNKYIYLKYLARQEAGLVGEYDLGRVGGLLDYECWDRIMSPRLIVEGRTIGRSGSDRFSIGTIEVNFCKEIATPADRVGKPVSWTYAYSIESGKFSSTTSNGRQRFSDHSSLCPEGFSMYHYTHNLLSIFRWTAAETQRTMNRSFSMPDIIVFSTCVLSHSWNSFSVQKQSWYLSHQSITSSLASSVQSKAP